MQKLITAFQISETRRVAYRKGKRNNCLKNFYIVSRLLIFKFCRKSDLTKESFDRDFKNHVVYKQNLQRIKKRRIPVIEGRTGHLPPIEDTKKLSVDQKGEKAPLESHRYKRNGSSLTT